MCPLSMSIGPWSRPCIIRVLQVSIIAQQKASSFAPWSGPYDHRYTAYLVSDGLISAEDMLSAASAQSAFLGWVLRAVSLAAATGGLFLSGAPLTQAAGSIPCVGGLLEGVATVVLCCVSLLAATGCWLMVVAVSWLWFRPVVSAILFGVAAVVLFVSCCWTHRSKRSAPKEYGRGEASLDTAQGFYPDPANFATAPLLPEGGFSAGKVPPPPFAPRWAAPGDRGCPYCGASQISSGARFCCDCGARL
mmetsp:Transcript_14580/g.39735  ORF Transcript_14580/g.39735 Transcript_14580/m.39735 type:complete len:248 (+) Transcript_14580:923-1666(+)